MRQVDATELLALHEWMREPDWAENFSLEDMANWINRRPTHTTARLIDPAQGARQAIIEECAQAAENYEHRDSWSADPDMNAQGYFAAGETCDEIAKAIRALPLSSTHREADELSEWKQAASVEAGLRREFMAQVDAAREFVKRHPALTLIDLAEFEAFLKVPAMVDAALSSTNLGSHATGAPSREPTGEYTITPAESKGAT